MKIAEWKDNRLVTRFNFILGIPLSTKGSPSDLLYKHYNPNILDVVKLEILNVAMQVIDEKD